MHETCHPLYNLEPVYTSPLSLHLQTCSSIYKPPSVLILVHRPGAVDGHDAVLLQGLWVAPSSHQGAVMAVLHSQVFGCFQSVFVIWLGRSESGRLLILLLVSLRLVMIRNMASWVCHWIWCHLCHQHLAQFLGHARKESVTTKLDWPT